MQQIACYLHKRISSRFKVPFIIECQHHPSFCSWWHWKYKKSASMGKIHSNVGSRASCFRIRTVCWPRSPLRCPRAEGGLVIEYDTVGVLLLSALEGVVSLFQICDHRQQTNRDTQDCFSPHVALRTIYSTRLYVSIFKKSTNETQKEILFKYSKRRE